MAIRFLILALIFLCAAKTSFAASPFGKGAQMIGSGKYSLFGKPVTHPEFEKFIKTLQLGQPSRIQFTDGNEDRYHAKTSEGRALDVRIGRHKSVGYGSVAED